MAKQLCYFVHMQWCFSKENDGQPTILLDADTTSIIIPFEMLPCSCDIVKRPDKILKL